jgi:hypothetical protein
MDGGDLHDAIPTGSSNQQNTADAGTKGKNGNRSADVKVITVKHTVDEFAEVFGGQWQFIGMSDGQTMALFQHKQRQEWVNAVNLETGEIVEL